MTIERLHFEEGYPLDSTRQPYEQIAEAWSSKLDDVRALPENEYDLTPEWWTTHLYKHLLTVFDNGTGLYRGIPRRKDVGSREFSKNGVGEHKPGGKVAHIPQDQEFIIISGPLKDQERLGIYEIIFYFPGPSPQEGISVVDSNQA